MNYYFLKDTCNFEIIGIIIAKHDININEIQDKLTTLKEMGYCLEDIKEILPFGVILLDKWNDEIKSIYY